MYLEIDEGFPKHRKTLRLRSIMRDPRAGWYMVDLWTWACRSCPDGDLTGISSYEIEEAANYSPRDGKLCQAMIDSGFVDSDAEGNPTGLHNWAKRTGAAIARMAKRASDMKALREQRKRDRDGTVAAQLHHGDATNPTRPDKTSPDQTRPDPENTDCAETPEASSPPAVPPLLTFPCDGSPNQWHLTQPQVDRWHGLFPSLNILAECRAALAWVEANPSKRKTAGGMPKTLVGWFTRSQNRGVQQASLLGQSQPRQAKY